MPRSLRWRGTIALRTTEYNNGLEKLLPCVTLPGVTILVSRLGSCLSGAKAYQLICTFGVPFRAPSDQPRSPSACDDGTILEHLNYPKCSIEVSPTIDSTLMPTVPRDG